MRTRLLLSSVIITAISSITLGQETPPKDLTKETERGIPVTDRLTNAKCGSCHQPDANGNLTRISWIRTTPEGWQEAIKRMVELNGLMLEPADARAIVKYLSSSHGLAP